MRAPVGRRDLVLDQVIDGFGVRDTQKRFGDTSGRRLRPSTGRIRRENASIIVGLVSSPDSLDDPRGLSGHRLAPVGRKVQQPARSRTAGLIDRISGPHRGTGLAAGRQYRMRSNAHLSPQLFCTVLKKIRCLP